MKVNAKVSVAGREGKDDPWSEFGLIVLVARLVGQGPGGALVKAFTLAVAVLEAVLSVYVVLVQPRSETTLSMVTEGGQVLVMYLAASCSALASLLLRSPAEHIIRTLNTMPSPINYKISFSVRRLATKSVVLVPLISYNLAFAPEMIYKSNWHCTWFYLPLVQLILAQLQMTTILDMLTKNMELLTVELPKCLGTITVPTSQQRIRRCCGLKEMDFTVEDRCISSSKNIVTVASHSSLKKSMVSRILASHEALEEAGVLVSSTFGLQCVFSLTRTLIVVTFNSFLFIRKELFYHINEGDLLILFKHSFSMVTILALHLLELWSLVSSADRFAKSAEKFTRNLFTAAIEDKTVTLAEMCWPLIGSLAGWLLIFIYYPQDEVRIHVASRRNNSVTAAGFIVIGYPIICYMLGAVTTYLAIIIQMGSEVEL